MSRFDGIITIGVLLVEAALAPLCWAAGNKVVSGRELLRVVRERDRGARRPPREVRIARGKVQADSPDAKEVLRRFAEARKSFTSFIVELEGETMFDYPPRIGKKYATNDIRFDGVRGKSSTYLWGNVSIAYQNVSKDQPQYISRLWDGENWYNYGQRTKSSEPDRVKMIRSKDPGGVKKEYTRFVQESMVPGLWMGYNRGDNGKRIDEVFGSAEHLELRQENLGGADCYVIDAAVKGKSKYTIWIDPVHDYHIAKIHVLVKGGDYLGTGKIPKGSSNDTILEVLSFQQIGGSWFPKRCKKTTRIMDEGKPGGESTIIDITNIILNPDHDALKSFTPYDIPNGAMVRITSFPPKFQFVWKDGKVLDKQGREVGPAPNKPESQPPVSRALPDLKGLGIDLEPNEARNKVILVCFFDMNQRPSRHTVTELAKKAAALKQKNVVILAVQTSQADPNVLARWVKDNNIPFQVGIVEGDGEKTRFGWGVKSLPWLILTDKEHVVRAEGFGLDELDGKTKEVQNVGR